MSDTEMGSPPGGNERWMKGLRAVLRCLLLLTAFLVVYDGFFGPKIAPKNLAGVLPWVHYRGILMIVLLAFGNILCMGCPMMTVRDFLRRFVSPRMKWPARLKNKWPAAFLFVLFLFCYETFSLWESPYLTAITISSFFFAASAVDLTFQGSSFCKHLCPIGQFNFIASTCSPFEVAVKDPNVCRSCKTKDCIRGRRESGKTVKKGCERGLFLPRKVGNLDCTFCMDCAFACRYGNVTVKKRVPAGELWLDPVRSGIGRISRRKDLGLLAVLFTFGALLHIFGMVSPVYAFLAWLGGVLGSESRFLAESVLFGISLVLEPFVLLGSAAWMTRRLTGSFKPLTEHIMTISFALVPLGFCIWTAHYLFHFLTGAFVFIPVLQHFLQSHGVALLGEPLWGLTGIPVRFVTPLQYGFLFMGLLGTLLITAKRTLEDGRGRFLAGFAPTALLAVVICVTAAWLLAQPMEMRGTLFGP